MQARSFIHPSFFPLTLQFFKIMKKPLKFSKTILLVLIAFLALPTLPALRAQSVSKARFDKVTKQIRLDETAPFGYLYQLDITPMGFTTKDKAEAFFSNWTTELVSFQVNFEKHTANVMLNLRLKPEFQVKDWNEVLANLPKQ